MNHLISTKFKIYTSLSKFFLFALLTAITNYSSAVVTTTKASGGTNISADKAANASSPAYTTLGNIILTEGAVTDFSIGNGVTFTINAPSGWTFNPGGFVSAVASPLNDITVANVLSVTSSLITIQLTISGNTNFDVLTISGIQVRANEGGNIPSSANMVRGGSAIVSGCSGGAILGSLSQWAGVINKLVITFPGQTFSDASLAATSGNSGTVTAQTSGVNFSITKIRACDQFFNVVTGYSGLRTISYSGPSNGLTAPTYVTNVSFASGVSSTILTTNLKKSESTTLTVTDGTTIGPVSSVLTVNPGVFNNFLVENVSGGNIGSQVTGIPFDIRITARDANNNTCTSGPNTFTGTVNITSSGTLASGSGTTAAFTGGVLTSHNVSISNQGNFTITATKTGGSATGNSNTFTVNYPPAFLTNISPSCVTPGDPGFVITVDGNNFSPSSVVRFNGSDRPTTFFNINQVSADINASDISSPGMFSISVYTPGTGTTAPLFLNTSTESTANITICQGSFYTLPDGVIQSMPGVYFSVIPNSGGCDSTITTYLSVNTNPLRSEFIFICPGSSYILPDGSIQNSPGIYQSLVTNPQGCDSIITSYISFHQAPMLMSTPVQIDCYGNRGSVQLNVFGGTMPYTFGPEPTINLIAGTYNYTVTDANGCTANTSATIDPEPSQLIFTASATQITCNGGYGFVMLNTSGGTPPYNWGGAPVSFLTPGTYNYQVMDMNGCTRNASATINAAPSALTANSTTTNTPCGYSTGSATVTATGGTQPYTYLWNTGATTRTITGIASGTYWVDITDNNGCITSSTATVGNSNSTPFTITGGLGICPGANTTLCAPAGFASYSWSNGESTPCITVNYADSFYVTVVDTLGCSSTKSAVTRMSTLPTCTITGGALCPNGTLVLRAPLGYFQYQWSNGIKTSYNSVRTAGTYTVTIKNTDLCTSSCSYTVISPLKVTVSKIDGKCANEYKGSATANASLGLPPYTYLWSNGATTSSISGLAAGTYTVRVTDAGGCVVAFSTTISATITTNDYSTISSVFNNNTITPGSTIWFSAVVNFDYTGSYPLTIRFRNQNIASSKFNIAPANAKLIITNAVSIATTEFIGGEWVTTAPPDLTGNYFVSGFAYPVITPIPVNLNPVKWKGVWMSSSSCVTAVHWKWSAAVYSNFTTDNSLIEIKPVDDNTATIYVNSDLAGTPDNFKSDCIAGAMGLGGNNYTGTYSTTGNRLPCATQDVCPSLRISGSGTMEEGESSYTVKAFPNPFNSITRIEFQKTGKSGPMSIEVYSIYGQKIKSLYNDIIEAGEIYSVDFDAADFADGIYICRFRSGDEEVREKLFLQR